MHDLVVRNARIIDGSGSPEFAGDLAVSDGVVTDVGNVDGLSHQEIDADGQLVLPGWVDIHTHYDGQATWDPEMTPSSWWVRAGSSGERRLLDQSYGGRRGHSGHCFGRRN